MGTQNSMPSFAQGSLENLHKLYDDGKINAPAFCYVTDKETMAFIDTKGAFHIILSEQVNQIQQTVDSLGDLNEIKDPSSGETISIVQYIEESQKRGSAIMITTTDDESEGGES